LGSLISAMSLSLSFISTCLVMFIKRRFVRLGVSSEEYTRTSFSKKKRFDATKVV